MGKTRNIKYQFKYCIDTHFREGMDKHSIDEEAAAVVRRMLPSSFNCRKMAAAPMRG